MDERMRRGLTFGESLLATGMVVVFVFLFMAAVKLEHWIALPLAVVSVSVDVFWIARAWRRELRLLLALVKRVAGDKQHGDG